MTYCCAVKLNAGLVFLSDSRTNAGLDQISTFRKMIVYEKPGDRFMCLLSAGNLSISQSVREILQVEKLKNEDGDPITIWNAPSMFDAARVLGSAVRQVFDRDGASLKASGVDVNVSMIFGGQIKGEGMRLFQVYSAGNFIEATPETPFFQIGESKYGKPVLDRLCTRQMPCTATKSPASTSTTRISKWCTAHGARNCARCLTASKTPPGTAATPRCPCSVVVRATCP